MFEYWESRYNEEGTMWKFEPSDSAIFTVNLFKSEKIKSILIPGIGYGRNAHVFCNNGIEVTGIEISKSAIDLAKANGLDAKIHCGSVTEMPFDDIKYDGIFCYALIHLLNKTNRQKFLNSCFNQLKTNGLIVFVVVSKEANMFGKGKLLSKDRFQISKGLDVYFYDSFSVEKEFGGFGLIEIRKIEEPIKHMVGQESLKCFMVICKKK